ncbi:MAG TPA: DUF4256 domain-containing protein [Cellvibrionaceae bacterium]|nr:DUF4256 domain-containing protein [Cellvibrionaceae bacterium]HMY39129.1 DUF4256 domain-containing protein [Marinagarivorans sp.]HNG58264.1 DUF4256 domain-containing protein [Cellvibrionaceae bacterium]
MKTADINNLLAILQKRFLSHMSRHPTIEWADVQAKLTANTVKLATLNEMEQTGGEPDLIGFDEARAAYVFCDCAAESPAGRRSLCYDQAALDARKENKPKGNAVATAAAMGIELLTEQDYRHLQSLGEFDKKTSSWIATPQAVRALGGALFCDRRYGQVFTYHNGAESYYAARGFRGLLRV